MARLTSLALAGGTLILLPAPGHAYVGPGAGFVFLSSFLAVAVALLLAVGVIVLGFLRLVASVLRGRRNTRPRKRVVILGFDGMDPNLTDEMIGAGQLPSLKRLAEAGDYRRLRTTCPALSPVAWSSFAIRM